MKLLVAYVTYHPKKDFLDRVKSNIFSSDDCNFFIFDNTENGDENLKNITSPNLVYFSEEINKGIAYALKYITDYAISKGYDYVLTFDQDSIVGFSLIKDSFEKISQFPEYGLIGLNYNFKYKDSDKILNVKFLITSGCYINLAKYKLVEGFNSSLFIDYVDFELCWQFKKKNIPIGVLTSFGFQHTIGNPIIKKFLFIKIKSLNHNPVRYYYRYRNELYCYKRDRLFFLKTHLKETLQIVTMILFEKDKKAKLKMIRLGKKDCRNGIFGEFNHEIQN